MAPTGLSRRAVLAGTAVMALGALTGCDSEGDREPGRDDRVRERLAARAQALVAQHEATLRRHPDLEDRLRPLVTEHEAHLTALGPAAPSPTASPSAMSTPLTVPDTSDDALAALATAEQQGSDEAMSLVSGTSPDLATLAASICGCRAAHTHLLVPGRRQ